MERAIHLPSKRQCDVVEWSADGERAFVRFGDVAQYWVHGWEIFTDSQQLAEGEELFG